MSYFTRSELLMGRDVKNPINQEQSDNLDRLIEALNPIREAWGSALYLSSGYRPSSINKSAGGAKKSAHLNCQAVDIKDQDGLFANFCLNNLTLLEENGMFMEDDRYTMTINSKGEVLSQWVHLQIRPTSRTVFIPYNGPIKLKVV